MQLIAIVVPVLVAIALSSVLDKSELFLHSDLVTRLPQDEKK